MSLTPKAAGALRHVVGWASGAALGFAAARLGVAPETVDAVQPHLVEIVLAVLGALGIGGAHVASAKAPEKG